MNKELIFLEQWAEWVFQFYEWYSQNSQARKYETIQYNYKTTKLE